MLNFSKNKFGLGMLIKNTYFINRDFCVFALNFYLCPFWRMPEIFFRRLGQTSCWNPYFWCIFPEGKQ